MLAVLHKVTMSKLPTVHEHPDCNDWLQSLYLCGGHDLLVYPKSAVEAQTNATVS